MKLPKLINKFSRLRCTVFSVLEDNTAALDPKAAIPRIEPCYITFRRHVLPRDDAREALQEACGELGVAAASEVINAQIIANWGEDQYTNVVDPNSGENTNYGTHLTVETFNGGNLTGRWHLYRSGAVWVDRQGDGLDIQYVCN